MSRGDFIVKNHIKDVIKVRIGICFNNCTILFLVEVIKIISVITIILTFILAFVIVGSLPNGYIRSAPLPRIYPLGKLPTNGNTAVVFAHKIALLIDDSVSGLSPKTTSGSVKLSQELQCT